MKNILQLLKWQPCKFSSHSKDQSKGGLLVMLSSMDDEVSIEASGLRQGIFSFNLIRCMRGNADVNKDKIVTVVELFDYVQKNVKEYTNNRQNPVISGNYDINIPITIIR
ncbi:caspase family protein [Bacteroidota bacterium]